MVNGNNIFISLDEHSAPFAATKANEIQVGAEKIPISSPNTGEWEEHIVGRKKWGFSISWLVGDTDKIKKLLMVGQTYTITVYGRNGSTTTMLLRGRASCLSSRTTLTQGSLANGSFSFEGNGMLGIPVTGITLNIQQISILIGDTQQLTATITPSDATVQQLQWSSSDESIATVDNEGNVTAVGEGTCAITCMATDGSGVSATCSCQVSPVLVEQIVLGNRVMNISVGGDSHNYFTILPENATNKQVAWSSSDPTIATAETAIDQYGEPYGLISTHAVGTCIITCTATDGSGVTDTCEVNVIA